MEKRIRRVISKISLVRLQANEFMRKELDQEGFSDLETAHGEILEVLLPSPDPVTMKVFVKRTGRAKSTVSGMIDTMEARGYVERKEIPDDKRLVGVVPTEKAKYLGSRFGGMSDKLLAAVYRDFSPEEQVQIVSLLERVIDNLLEANREEL